MSEIKARNLHDIWFQQDGATCHTARETMDLLRSRFGEQFISRLVISEIPTEVLKRVVQNWCLRMDELKSIRCQHLKGVIFKK